MKDRFPTIYDNDTCVRCKLERETQLHLFMCSKNQIDIKTCKQTFIQILINQITNESSIIIDINLKETLYNLPDLSTNTITNTRDPAIFSFADILMGLVPSSLQTLIQILSRNKCITDHIIHNTMEKFKIYIYENFWIPRCREVKRWELTNGIKYRNKRKVRSVPLNIVDNSINNGNNGDNNSNGDNNNNNTDINKNRDTKQHVIVCCNIVNKFISNFVRYGMNWVGLYKIGCSAGP
jgi:hypothetical protein